MFNVDWFQIWVEVYMVGYGTVRGNGSGLLEQIVKTVEKESESWW